MKRVLLFWLTVFAFNVCYAEGKPSKLSKYIYFDGEVVKKTPKGHGDLILERSMANHSNYHIVGDFDGNKINNATFYISKEEETCKISGNFYYSIDKKNCTLTLEPYDVTIEGLSYEEYWHEKRTFNHIDMGKIIFVKGHAYYGAKSGMIFSEPYRKHFVAPVSDRSTPKAITCLASSSTCEITADIKVSAPNNRGFFGIKEKKHDDAPWVFPDGSKYKRSKAFADIYTTLDGDKILCKIINDKRITLEPDSKIITKDKCVITINNWKILDVLWGDDTSHGKWDVQLNVRVDFPDGANYDGTLVLNQLGPAIPDGGWPVTVFKHLKAMTASDMRFYDGTFHKNDGSTVLFQEGKSKNTNKEQLDNLVSDIAYEGKIISLSELLEFSEVDYNYVENTESYVHDRIDEKARYHIFKMEFLAADHVVIQNGRCVCYVYDERTTNGKYYLTINKNRIYFNLSKSRVIKEKEVYRNGSKRDEYTYLDLGPASLIPKEKLNNVSVVFVTTSEEERISYYGVDYYGYQPVAVLIVDRNSNVIANASNMLSGGTDQYKSKSTVTVPDARPIGCFFCKGSGLDFYDHHQPCAICGGKGYVLR